MSIAAEKMVLAALLQYGKEFFFEVENKVDEFCFETTLHNDNGLLYRCLYETAKNYNEVNYSTVLLSAENMGIAAIIKKKENLDQLAFLKKNPVNLDDAIKASQQLRKKALAKQLQTSLIYAAQELGEFTGNEPLSDILSKPSDALSKVLDKVEDDDRPSKMFMDIVEYLTFLKENPREIIGLPTPHPIYNDIIGGGLRRGCVNIVVARPKALRYGSKVYTKEGFKLIENIQIGDSILHPYCGETLVTNVLDYQNKDIYRIYFRDGDFVDCCEDHIWQVNKRYNKNKQYLKTTKELLLDITYGTNKYHNNYKWDILLPNPVHFEPKKVSIDPYVLGALLGDGSIGNNTCVYHTADEEIHQYILEYANSIGKEVKVDKQSNGKCVSYRINSMQNKLREVGVFGENCYNKHIPLDYIYNSIDVRLAILSGLLDTDGDCTIDKRSKNGRIRFCSVSYKLCLGVKEIVQSLGGLCSIISNKSNYNEKVYNSYRCEIRLPNGINPFRIKRKRNNFSGRKIGSLKRTIIKIEKIAVDNARCLTVSNNDGLFITDNYVVTHNCGKSTFAKNTALFLSTEYNVPCLYLDTEMHKQDQQVRSTAEYADETIGNIEHGNFDENVIAEMSKIKDVPFYHKKVAGMDFESILSICNRWVKTVVGREKDGQIKDCLIIYDYFKLMNPDHKRDMKEYEAIGHQLDKLKTFVNVNNISCLAFTQSNRENDVSQSDRISWFASSVCFLEKKTPEEIAGDGGPKNGNVKIRSKYCRYGGGLEEGDYISLDFNGAKSRMKEVNTRFNLQQNSRSAGFEIDDSEPDEEDA